MMTISYSMFFYLTSIFLFLISNNPILFWLMMEVNLLLFLFLMFSSDVKKVMFKEDSAFFYFIIQSLGSFSFLMCIYLKNENNFYSDLFFFLSLSLKLGIFPFYFWMLYIGESLIPIIFLLILSIQKIPLFMMLFLTKTEYILLLLSISFLLGSVLVYFSNSLIDLLVFSSVSSSLLIYLVYLNGYFSYFAFFLFYFFSLLVLFEFNFKSKPSIFNIFFFMFISGLPPFSLFFFKFLSMMNLFFIEVKFIFFFFWLFSLFSMLGYTKFFYKSFFLSFFTFKNMYIKKTLPILSMLFFSLFFLI